MFKRDDDGSFIGLIIVLSIVAIVIYITIILATILLGVATAGGTLYGGGSAIKNYFSSFKENVIDSNRVPSAA